ncbi:MAG: 23S rRNA pseudouridine synthase F, partial [Bacteroidia bacterium]
GVDIGDAVTKKCFVKQESVNKFRIILTQGLNRQIRRMCDAFDYKVYKLQRIRIMNIKLDGINSGGWRYLTTGEINTINDLVASSSKTEEASVINDLED